MGNASLNMTGRKLGSLNLTGRIITEAAAVADTILASPAGITVQGATVSIVSKDTLQVSPASISISGQTVTIETGTPADVIQLSPAAVTVVGAEVSVAQHDLVSVSPATISVVGQTVAIESHDVISLSAATVTIAGQTLSIVEGAASNPLLDILTASWEMEEASGDRVDSHGSMDLSEVNAGSISQVTGVTGNGVGFTSNNGILRSTSPAPVQVGSGSKSYELWIKMSSIPTGFRGLLLLGATNSTDEGINIALYGTNSTIRVNISNGSSRTILDGNSSVLSVDTWHQICVVVDRVGNRLKLYVDGTEIGDKSISSFSADDIQSDDNFDINGFFVSGGIVGDMDNVRVYDGILTSSMLTFLYNSRSSRTYADLSNYSE